MADTKTRTERDTMGTIEVPADRLWGAQTQRSLENFPIGHVRMPSALVHALGMVKRAAAETNRELGTLDPTLADAIAAAAKEVSEGRWDDHFPLVVWQTGSGTQSNMNANEVIAALANERLEGSDESATRVHPNDHVNRSQSSNDTFPTAMHIAAVGAVVDDLKPALGSLRDALRQKADDWQDIVKIGRTHTQDATPLTLGQEFGAFAAQLDRALSHLDGALPGLLELAQGGTAVGTGLNAPKGFADGFARRVAEWTGQDFVSAPNKFEHLAAHDAIYHAHAAVAGAAMACFKIANDIRLLASGPRAGLGELALPANEPGSSIMPGKVNPTQCEALTQVAAHVHGNHAGIGFAASQGQFQLNVFKPMMAFAFLDSSTLLAAACRSFETRCVVGIEPRLDNIRRGVERSLMLVTALAPEIGYEAAAKIAKEAHESGRTLREVAIDGGHVDAATYDELVRPEAMLGSD